MANKIIKLFISEVGKRTEEISSILQDNEHLKKFDINIDDEYILDLKKDIQLLTELIGKFKDKIVTPLEQVQSRIDDLKAKIKKQEGLYYIKKHLYDDKKLIDYHNPGECGQEGCKIDVVHRHGLYGTEFPAEVCKPGDKRKICKLMNRIISGEPTTLRNKKDYKMGYFKPGECKRKNCNLDSIHVHKIYPDQDKKINIRAYYKGKDCDRPYCEVKDVHRHGLYGVEYIKDNDNEEPDDDFERDENDE